MNLSEGKKLIKKKEFGTALKFLLKFEKKNTSDIQIYFYLGLVNFELNNFDKSILYYEKFLKEKPKSEAALLNLAIVNQTIGKLKSAEDIYLNIISINKLNIKAYYGIYNLDSKKISNKIFENLYEINKKEKLDLYDKGIINFLLSKKEKIKNNFDKEIEYLNNSHENIFNYNYSYNLSAQFYYNQIISKYFDKIRIIKKNKTINDINNIDIQPIFIVGLPRSGSTLIESILTSSKEKLVSFGECHVINMCTLEEIGPKIYSKNFEIRNFEFNINQENIKKNILERYSQYHRLDKSKFIDKSLENFFNLEIIINIFPKAKFLHTFRNSLDSIISIYQSMLPDLSWTHKIEDILSYIDNYKKVSEYYKLKYPKNFLDINLEKFTLDSEKFTKKIFNFCELTWNKNTLEFYKRKDLHAKTLSFKQVRSKILKYNDKKYQSYFHLLNDHKLKYNWLKSLLKD